MIYRYNINNKLVTSFKPLENQIALSITDEEAKYCIGFDNDGNLIYDQEEIDKNNLKQKQEAISIINSNFDKECKEIGVEFTGAFQDINGEQIINPRFQYDDESQNRLLKFKDISECSFWRSVHSTDYSKNNRNVVLTNVQKNTLYNLLLTTWGNKFLEKSLEIDSL